MAMMRQEKLSRLVQRELGVIFQRDSKSQFEGMFITVTGVRITADLGLASVYLSFLDDEKAEAGIELVRARSSYVRNALAGVIKNSVRKIPELRFFIDDSLAYAAHIEELLKK